MNQFMLAATTFFAKSRGDVCGVNGLPKIANSIAILGLAQRLKGIRHKNLCQYVDVIRSKHERTIVVTEYFGCTNLQEVQKKGQLKQADILHILRQLITALSKLNELSLVAHNIEPKHILLDKDNNVKLFNYGLYYMTKGGDYVPFPIGNVCYMAPERHLGSKNNIKSDIWSVGVIAAELLLGKSLWSNMKISNITRKILSLCQLNSAFEKLAQEHECLEIYQALNAEIREMVDSCLDILPAQRPLPQDLLQHKCFEKESSEYNGDFDSIEIQTNRQIF